jgi:hypothetical protein
MTRLSKFGKNQLCYAALAIVLIPAHFASAQEASDATYSGSSFYEVLSVIEDQGLTSEDPKVQQEISVYRSGQIPQYPVSFKSLKAKVLSDDSKRTLVERADYYERLEKLVHPNGICVVGDWNISKDSAYSGYFSKGAKGHFIGRISTALEETTRAGNRGFGFAGKIFPTTNPNAKVLTTNFFTIDVLSGTPAQRFLDVSLTNSPPIIPSFDIIGELAKIIPAFLKADSQPTFRPVTQIARTNAAGEIKSPIYMRLSPQTNIRKNNQIDFRRELFEAMQQNGEKLQFNIDVSDTTSDRNISEGWQNLGEITLNRAMVTYGCDRRLHFSHPKDDKSNK